MFYEHDSMTGVMSPELKGVKTRDLNVRFIMSGQSRGKCNLRRNYV